MRARAEQAKTNETSGIHVQHYAEEHGVWRPIWTCEKYEQDKVDFVIAELKSHGDSGIVHSISGEDIWRPFEDGVPSGILKDFQVTPDDIVVVPGNLLVNEGIQRMLDLLIVAGGTGYNNANAFIGVGDSSTAEAATQTELQAAANRFYKGMNATFPSRANQTITWASDFTSTEANFVWAEWTIAAGATTASGAGFTNGTTNLNRKVQSLGTKATGTWTLTVTLTIS